MRIFISSLFLLLISTSLLSQSKISGTIVEMTTGAPIPNATVYLYDEYNIALKNEIRTQTDEYGYYEFENLEIRKYSVNAFVYYEYMGDSIAFVFQPGYVTLEKNADDDPVYNSYTKKDNSNEYDTTFTGLRLNFGFSESYFRYTMESKGLVRLKDLRQINLRNSIRTLTRPRISSNAEPNIWKHFTFVTEKKTW